MGSFYNLPLNAPGIKKARQRETYGSRARRRHGRPVRHLVNGKAERFNDEAGTPGHVLIAVHDQK